MPPNLRPRPAGAQKPALQPQPSSARKLKPKAGRARGGRQKSKAVSKKQKAKVSVPSAASKALEGVGKSTPEDLSREPQQGEQSQETSGKQEKAIPPVRRRASDTRSDADAAKVTSWLHQINQEQALQASGNLLKDGIQVPSWAISTPWYQNAGLYMSKDMASTCMKDTETQAQEDVRGTGCFLISNPNVVTILSERNVNFLPVTDENIDWIESNIITTINEVSSAEEVQHWKDNLSKCRVSNEAIFQRTIMMDLIDRHHLPDALDYTCESQWMCMSSMPQRHSEFSHRMPKPRPDLAIAFKAESLLPSFMQADLKSLRGVMCPESLNEESSRRAFHFLSIEVKGALGENANWSAHRQNFNTATQALHNMYTFMNMAGEEMLEQFYSKARFYSIVATSRIFHVRVHRAVKLGSEGRIRQDYPLGFVYDVAYDHEGGNYTKAKATGIVRNILFEYGVKVLQPLLAQTMDRAWRSLQTTGGAKGVASEAEARRTRVRAASRSSQNAAPVLQRSRKSPSIPLPQNK